MGPQNTVLALHSAAEAKHRRQLSLQSAAHTPAGIGELHATAGSPEPLRRRRSGERAAHSPRGNGETSLPRESSPCSQSGSSIRSHSSEDRIPAVPAGSTVSTVPQSGIPAVPTVPVGAVNPSQQMLMPCGVPLFPLFPPVPGAPAESQGNAFIASPAGNQVVMPMGTPLVGSPFVGPAGMEGAGGNPGNSGNGGNSGNQGYVPMINGFGMVYLVPVQQPGNSGNQGNQGNPGNQGSESAS